MSARYTCRHHGAEETTHGDLVYRTCGCDGTVHHACQPRRARAGAPRPADWPAALTWRTEEPDEEDGCTCRAPNPTVIDSWYPSHRPSCGVWTARNRRLAERRRANYEAHFDGCADCSGHPDGECARAVELREAWRIIADPDQQPTATVWASTTSKES